MQIKYWKWRQENNVTPTKIQIQQQKIQNSKKAMEKT